MFGRANLAALTVALVAVVGTVLLVRLYEEPTLRKMFGLLFPEIEVVVLGLKPGPDFVRIRARCRPSPHTLDYVKLASLGGAQSGEQ